MSKNSDTFPNTIKVNLVALLTVAFIAFIIIKQDKNTFEKPMTLEKNVIWIDYKDTQMDLWMLNNADVYGIQFEFGGVKLIDSDGGVLNREKFIPYIYEAKYGYLFALKKK